MAEKNTLFTIGQFAALHGINKKTLMWYDEIGLFKPAVVKENGYRYYTYFQSSMLETILMLRELDVPVKEIQTFLQNRSGENLKALLEEKITRLDEELLRLKATRKALVSRKEQTAMLLKLNLEEIRIVEKPARYLVAVPIPAQATFEKEIELMIAKMKEHRLPHLHDALCGSMIPVECLYSGAFEGYSALFMDISNPVGKKGLHLQPKGRYLRAFCQGSWNNLPRRYQELLRYAEQHKLVLCGYAYETGLNETIVRSMDEYITQIEIPLKD